MEENLIDEKRFWYALYTKPRHEFKAKIHLESVNVEHYLPTMIVKKKWSDRIKKIEEPIFRGYVFIYANEKERAKALYNPCIVRTITFNGKPAVIPDWQIENLKIMLVENPEVFITDQVEVGAKVRIVSGPFTDVVGIVQEKHNGSWLAVSIDLLQRSILVQLPKESIVKFIEN